MGAERGDGWNGSFEIMWTNPRHESFLQDRSGPWEESTKTVVQKADGQRVQFTAFTAGFTITCWTVSSDTDSNALIEFF